jgi:hypothetical protein
MKGQVEEFFATIIFIAIVTVVVILGVAAVVIATGNQIEQSFAFRQEIAQGSGTIQGLLALKRGDRSFGEIALQSVGSNAEKTVFGAGNIEQLLREISGGFGVDNYAIGINGLKIDSVGAFCGDITGSQVLAWCEQSCTPGRDEYRPGKSLCASGHICCRETYDKNARSYPGDLFYKIGDARIGMLELSCAKNENGKLTSGACEIGGCSPGREVIAGADVSSCHNLLRAMKSKEPVLSQKTICCKPVDIYKLQPFPSTQTILPLWRENNLTGDLHIGIEVKA